MQREGSIDGIIKEMAESLASFSDVRNKLQSLPAARVAHLIDRVVKEESNPLLNTLLHELVVENAGNPQMMQTGPMETKPSRSPYLRSGSQDLSTEVDKLPVFISGHGIPAFMACDAEFLRELKTNKNVVVMFTAVAIPVNRGRPEIKLHTIVNPGPDFKPQGYDIRFIHNIRDTEWRRHLPMITFTSLLSSFTLKSKLLFWDVRQDALAIAETFHRCARDPADVLRSLVDIQQACTQLLVRYLDEDQQQKVQENRLSLKLAVNALIEKISVEKKVPEMHLLHLSRTLVEINEGKINNRKSSRPDAEAVAYLYNHLHSELPSLEELATETRKSLGLH